MVLSTTAAGTIIQTARGVPSFFAKSASEAAPTASSFASASTDFGKTSKTTHSCPARISRRTMLAPIRPSPIIPICMCFSWFEAGRGSEPGSARGPVQALRGLVEAGGSCLMRRTRRMSAFVEPSCASVGSSRALELGDDALREHLPELDPPLVERVDVPDHALGEDGVLVEGDEPAERGRREPVEQQRVRRAVALEDAVGHEPVGRALGLHLVRGLAERERLGLREDVREQDVVVAPERGRADGRTR